MKVAKTLFHEFDSGKNEARTGPFFFKLLRRRTADIIAIVKPAQKGRKPGPGSCHAPISTLRAYREKKTPIIKKKIAEIRSYWLCVLPMTYNLFSRIVSLKMNLWLILNRFSFRVNQIIVYIIYYITKNTFNFKCLNL